MVRHHHEEEEEEEEESNNSNNNNNNIIITSDDNSTSDSDGHFGDSHTLYELRQLARAYNMEHAFIPLNQNKAALTAVLIERGVLAPAGGRRSPPTSSDDEYDDGYEYHAVAADDNAAADEFEERGMCLIDRLADMAAERAVDKVLALPKKTLSSLSGLYNNNNNKE
mgnify:CR=1 FL=1